MRAEHQSKSYQIPTRNQTAVIISINGKANRHSINSFNAKVDIFAFDYINIFWFALITQQQKPFDHERFEGGCHPFVNSSNWL